MGKSVQQTQSALTVRLNGGRPTPMRIRRLCESRIQRRGLSAAGYRISA